MQTSFGYHIIWRPALEQVRLELAGMKALPGAGVTGRDLLGALAVSFLPVYNSPRNGQN